MPNFRKKEKMIVQFHDDDAIKNDEQFDQSEVN